MVNNHCAKTLRELRATIREFAHQLRLEFSSDINRDAGEFKRRVIAFLKAELPPGRGRPRTMIVSRAAEMRIEGKTWQQVYAECLSHVVDGSDSRQLAQYRLRCAVRSRRNARRRRKLS